MFRPYSNLVSGELPVLSGIASVLEVCMNTYKFRMHIHVADVYGDMWSKDFSLMVRCSEFGTVATSLQVVFEDIWQ